MDAIKARCSSLPLAFICPPSVHVIDLCIDHTGEPAGVGTAVHRALAPLVEGMAPATALEVALDMHRDVPAEEVRPLFWVGAKMWEELLPSRNNAVAEVELSATVTEGDVTISMTGHIDVLSLDRIARRAVVDDWKTGRCDRDYHHQGFGYASLVLLNEPDIDEVQVNFLWVRTKEIEPYTVTRERMNQWLEELMATVGKWDGAYHDGPHCAHCRRNHDCPASVAMIRRDVAMFADDAKVQVEAMDSPTFATYWRKLKALESTVKEAREHAKIEVDRRGGEVADGSGLVIHFVDRSAGREVDFIVAKPVISKVLTEEEYAPAIKLSAKKLDDIVAKKAGRGKGAEAKRELAKLLEEAGAVAHENHRVLVEEREK
jgi:hypothetical protein